MQTQDSGELNNVVTRLRGRIWRDRLVAALFAVGVVLNFAAVNVAVKAAMAKPATASVVAGGDEYNSENPDAGLLVAHRDGSNQRVAAAQ